MKQHGTNSPPLFHLWHVKWCKPQLKNSKHSVEYLQLQLSTYQTPSCNNARHLRSHTWSDTHLQDKSAFADFRWEGAVGGRGGHRQLNHLVPLYHKIHKLGWSVGSRGFLARAWYGPATWLSAPRGRWTSPNCSSLGRQSPPDEHIQIANSARHLQIRASGWDQCWLDRTNHEYVVCVWDLAASPEQFAQIIELETRTQVDKTAMQILQLNKWLCIIHNLKNSWKNV